MELFQLHEDHYVYQKIDGITSIYFFKTIFDVEYKVILKPSPYLFGDAQPYADLLYEFSLLAKFTSTHSFQRDELIAPTIATIFLDFYNGANQNVCFYICDSSDNKQHVRKRKFDTWFDKYNRGAFLKLDAILNDTNGTQYPVSIVMRKNNLYKDDLLKAFTNLISGYNDEK